MGSRVIVKQVEASSFGISFYYKWSNMIKWETQGSQSTPEVTKNYQKLQKLLKITGIPQIVQNYLDIYDWSLESLLLFIHIVFYLKEITPENYI